jgi:hypothetical protein
VAAGSGTSAGFRYYLEDMVEQKNQNTHYIPEWLLWKFRKPYLFELDIFTGETKQRNPKNAASGTDLWPNDIEDNLSVHDNDAAQICRNKLAGKDRIVLTPEEKIQFSKWLSQFYIRAPKRLDGAKRFLDDNSDKLDDYIQQAVYNNRDRYLSDFRAKHAVAYEAVVTVAGPEVADAHILDTYVELYKASGGCPM